MGLCVPHPKSKKDLWCAGPNGDGVFLVVNEHGDAVTVPDEWRWALASHLLLGSGIFDPKVTAFLRELQAKAGKKRGGKLSGDDGKRLRELADRLEDVLQEYLEADPKTSTRYEYRPEYYEQRVRRMGLKKPEPEPVVEDIDDTPVPWEG
jgi:hypothetical protein